MDFSVLIVDDEADILKLLRELLERKNYEVDTCPDGESALALAKQKKFDAILADLKMPGVSGSELIKRLRKEQPETPIIVMTGFGRKVKKELDGMGIHQYFVKPIHFEDLFSCLENLRTGGRQGPAAN